MQQLQTHSFKLKPEVELKQYKYQCTDFKIIADIWFCSSSEKDQFGNKLDGAYPAGFMKRVKAAFAEYYPQKREEILHVCSGRIQRCQGMRLDIDPKYKPDFVCDAQNMKPVKSNSFRWVQSDTPYNKDAASRYYGKPMLNKNKVLKEMTRVCKVGGFIAVFDESFPVLPPSNIKCVARIAVTSIPNLTFRCFTVFKKVSN